MKLKQKKREDDIIRIHTDGSIFKNRGDIGGFGAVLKYKKLHKEMAGRVENTTINRMEMMGAIYALKLLNHKDKVIHVYSDSQYLVKGMNEWMVGWLRRNWIGSTGAPVKNKDLWEDLKALNDKLNIKWIWIRGHVGHEWNERADVLAKAAALGEFDADGGNTEEALRNDIERCKRSMDMLNKLKGF